MSAPLRSISIQAMTTCLFCGGAIPLNAMVPRICCPRCSGENELEDAVWLAAVRSRTVRNFTGYINGRDLTLRLDGKEPACVGCGAVIPQEAVRIAVRDGSVGCTSCDARTRVRLPPSAFEPDGFRVLVGEDELQIPAPEGAAAAVREATKPVAFTCPLCAGVLRVDGSARVVTCEYCTGSVYLPDDLWHVFHPVHRVRTWFLLVDES